MRTATRYRALGRWIWTVLGANFQTFVAVTMAVIAALGAVVAYEAAVSEQNASRLERRLAQDHMQEQLIRQDWHSRIAKDARLLTRFQANIDEAESLQQEADSTADPSRALSLDLRARGQLAVARALSPFIATVNAKRGLVYRTEEVLEQKLAAEQRSGGGLIWRTQKDTKAAHQKTESLALAVVVFVLALFVCTLAQVLGPRLGLGLALLGAAVALVALARSMWIAPEIRFIFAYAAGPFALVGVVSWKLFPGLRRWLFGRLPHE